ncbi:hypothetical protein CRG98_033997 [Punica granatum]|uniref:Uncharacterized protein n=1 Tax=Punica granatum TaxID=22663 RepID=A0A2I0INW0_PUNGR|nr:hypothetical protein CRG98_033997 [Punica granatum]
MQRSEDSELVKTGLTGQNAAPAAIDGMLLPRLRDSLELSSATMAVASVAEEVVLVLVVEMRYSDLGVTQVGGERWRSREAPNDGL